MAKFTFATAIKTITKDKSKKHLISDALKLVSLNKDETSLGVLSAADFLKSKEGYTVDFYQEKK